MCRHQSYVCAAYNSQMHVRALKTSFVLCVALRSPYKFSTRSTCPLWLWERSRIVLGRQTASATVHVCISTETSHDVLFLTLTLPSPNLVIHGQCHPLSFHRKSRQFQFQTECFHLKTGCILWIVHCIFVLFIYVYMRHLVGYHAKFLSTKKDVSRYKSVVRLSEIPWWSCITKYGNWECRAAVWRQLIEGWLGWRCGRTEHLRSKIVNWTMMRNWSVNLTSSDTW